MSSPSPNNRAFHGKTITIVCKGLPRKNAQARRTGEELEAGEAGLSGIHCSPFIIRQPENAARRAGLSVAWTLTCWFPRESHGALRIAPGTLTSGPRAKPCTDSNPRLGCEQECPVAHLQGVPFTDQNVQHAPRMRSAEAPTLLPSCEGAEAWRFPSVVLTVAPRSRSHHS